MKGTKGMKRGGMAKGKGKGTKYMAKGGKAKGTKYMAKGGMAKGKGTKYMSKGGTMKKRGVARGMGAAIRGGDYTI
jgi:hypothetical protein